jgi:hypothetical protein
MSLTRRELLVDLTKDALKNVFGAYHEFTKAHAGAKKILSCDDAARMLWKKNQESSRKFFKNLRKEG